jgi:hypothetical protein
MKNIIIERKNDVCFIVKCISCTNTLKIYRSEIDSNLETVAFTCSMTCRKVYRDTKEYKDLFLERNRVSCIFKTEKFKEGYKQKMLEKYGVENSFSSEIVQEQIKKINLERYGVENPQQNKEINKKTNETRKEKYGEDGLVGWCPKEKQSTYFKDTKFNLEYYTERYGEEIGREKYLTNNKAKGNTLENYIKKFGEELGEKKFKEKNLKSSPTLENSIRLHGEEEGLNKYLASKKLRIKGMLTGSKSKQSIQLFSLMEKLGVVIDEYEFPLKKNKTHYFYDCKVGKILVEFNGSFWHANPEQYKNPIEVIDFPGGTSFMVKDLWEKDQIKLNVAIEQGYKVLVVWCTELKDIKQLENKIKETFNV